MYNVIKAAKKPRGTGVPGDLPKKLVKEFPVELAKPVANLFRSIIKASKWPTTWAVEHGIALKKVQVPLTESDLRVISLTNFWSKCMETFVIDWLNKIIGDKIDYTQYGGLKGHSTSHYMVDLVNFVLYNQDLNNPHATLAILYDFSKAFNRQDHQTLITLLSDLGTPGWLLKLVIAFLEDRRMVLRHRGCTSGEESLPGGGPQGTKLGLFLFLILINSAGYETNRICKQIGLHITQERRKPIKTSQQKYIDDMTQLAALDLKKIAVQDPNPTPSLPRQYHERTGHVLLKKDNPLSEELEKFKNYAKTNQMVINEEKTKLMIFNTATSVDVMPELEISNGKVIEVVDETKLLGLIVRSDLKWHSNTKNIISKSYRRMWILRNLKKFGAGEQELVDTYFQQIRNIAEMACAVWNSGLTQQEIGRLERIQKTALAVIRGESHTTYAEALCHFGLDTLEARRKKLCLKFALKHTETQNSPAGLS